MPHSLFLLFLSLIFFSGHAACPESISISPALSAKTCTYYYSWANSTCTFVQCLSKMSANSPLEYLGWSQCLSECCSDVSLPSTDDNIELLLACDRANQAKRAEFIGLIAGFMGFLVLMSIVCFICYQKQSCPLRKCLDKLPQHQNTNNHSKQPLDDIKQIANMVENPTSVELTQDNKKEPTISEMFTVGVATSATKAPQSSGKNMRMLKARCLVCQQGKPNCQLNCNHHFHNKCLGLWFERNPAAPCGDDNVKIVRMFCQQCLKATGAISVHKFKSIFRKEAQKFSCSECRRSSQ